VRKNYFPAFPIISQIRASALWGYCAFRNLFGQINCQKKTSKKFDSSVTSSFSFSAVFKIFYIKAELVSWIAFFVLYVGHQYSHGDTVFAHGKNTKCQRSSLIPVSYAESNIEAHHASTRCKNSHRRLGPNRCALHAATECHAHFGDRSLKGKCSFLCWLVDTG
jgi:hypothetical protein